MSQEESNNQQENLNSEENNNNNNSENNNNENENNNNEEEEEYKNYDILPFDYSKLENFANKNVEIIEGKLSNITHLQEKEFNINTYINEPKLKIKNEKDEEEIKLIPLQNYIRWKYDKEKKKPISNTKLIEWSDGSYQLVVGDKFFDIKCTDYIN